MAMLQINEDYRIKSDDNQWIVQRKTGFDKKKQEDIWTALTYHLALFQAVDSLTGRLLRTSNAEGVDEILEECRKIKEMIAEKIAA